MTFACWTAAAFAVAPDVIRDLAFGDADQKDKALGTIVQSGDAQAIPILRALIDGDVKAVGEERVLLVKDDAATDLLTGQAVKPLPDNLDDVVVNNRYRRALGSAIAALKLASPDRAVRAAAAKELAGAANEDMLHAIVSAITKETDPEIRSSLKLTQASIQFASHDKATRLAAVRELGQSDTAQTRVMLLGLLEKKGGTYVEPDAEIRAEAQRSLSAVERRLVLGDIAARVFTGISLGTILLLAALGLAITYGLMGVINMAHGELIMIGAYATYVSISRARSTGISFSRFRWRSV